MFNWKNRKYVNPRKRVFKNIDTGEILNLELQDDPNNIEEESETPLNAHNLNLAQQEILDDMSKTYRGTSITTNTVEGYGRINKIWGHTIEEGTGEKSPDNPYTLRCVGDDVNLFDVNKIEQTTKNGITCTVSEGVITFNGTCTQDNTRFVARFNNLVKNIKGKTNVFIEYLSGTIENTTNTTVYSMFEMGYEHQMYNELLTQNMKHVSNFDDNFNFYAMQIRFDNGVKANNYKIRIKVSQINANVWSSYNYGTAENISKNGDQQSSNVVVTKPLCCLKDGGNIIAQDYLGYDGVVHREVSYAVYDGSEEWRVEGANQDYYECIDTKINHEADTQTSISNMFNQTIISATSANNIVGYSVKLGGESQIRVRPQDNLLNNLTAFKKWLSLNPLIVIAKRAVSIKEPIDCSNQIVQYEGQTTISNRDGAEIEVTLTNNKAISEINEEMGLLRNDVKQTNNYSTTEQKIGTWIDGKSLYRKIVSTTTPTVTTDGTFANKNPLLISNAEYCIVEFAYVTGINNQKQPLPYLNNSGKILKCFIEADNSLYIASNGTAFNGMTIIASLLYTKI